MLDSHGVSDDFRFVPGYACRSLIVMSSFYSIPSFPVFALFVAMVEWPLQCAWPPPPSLYWVRALCLLSDYLLFMATLVGLLVGYVSFFR